MKQMTQEEIAKLFEGAPDDAQAYMPRSFEWLEGWWKTKGDVCCFWSVPMGIHGGWQSTYARPFGHKSLIMRPDRPANPQWSGEGLPPVGVVCEWREKTGFQWVPAEVLFVSDRSIVLRRADGFEWQLIPARIVCRPVPTIRTPEQIAADEREAAIAEMVDSLGCDSDSSRTREFILCGILYDANYRKVGQGK